MNHQIHTIYTFNNEHESLLDLSVRPMLTDLDSNSGPPDQDQNGNIRSYRPPSSYWRPGPKLQRLFDRFQNTVLSQWPRIPCVYRGRLLYPEKACWTFYDASIIYPLQQHIQNVSLFFNPNTNRIPKLRVPTCDAYKKPSTRFAFSHLSPLPEEIISVPLHKRRYLSPVFLHNSLGRIPNSNPYSKYRSLTGQMNYSHNIRAHTLYSGALGAFLESNKDRDPSDQDRHSSYDKTL